MRDVRAKHILTIHAFCLILLPGSNEKLSFVAPLEALLNMGWDMLSLVFLRYLNTGGKDMVNI